jgi:hypothetical protein
MRTTRAKRTTILTSTAALLAAVLLPAGAAGAAPGDPPGVSPSCGDTVSVDTVLTGDLVCPGGDGLTLAAGVTLDLGGHSLVGPGTSGTAITFEQTAPVTVTNGTVRGWRVGVASDGLTSPSGLVNTIRSVTFEDVGTGIDAFLDRYAVESSRFIRNGLAIAAFSSGIFTVDRSTFVDGSDVGFSGTRMVVTGSSFVASGLDCIDGGLEVTRSSFTRAETAIRKLDCNGGLVEDSTFVRNGTAIFAGPGNVSIPDRLLRNRFVRNGDAVVTWIGADLRGNQFLRNGRGVYAPNPSQETVAVVHMDGDELVRNRDAVVVEMVGSLRDTRAVRNTGIGIHAPLTTDLGGNVAFGNGVEPQCTGVVCSGR